MLYYRLYSFDRFSGHIDHFREFEAEDDDAALILAERWQAGGPMELWNRERRLKRWTDGAVAD
jgi:hypothetical protein